MLTVFKFKFFSIWEHIESETFFFEIEKSSNYFSNINFKIRKESIKIKVKIPFNLINFYKTILQVSLYVEHGFIFNTSRSLS